MDVKTMKAAVLFGKNDLRIEEVPVPVIKENEVLVQIKKVGICGSDIHYYKEGRIGDFIVNKPMILGHESAGIVVEVGTNVTNLKPGDRVTIEPGIPCLKCRHCKEGHYNLCQNIFFFATPPDDGAFCKYVAFSKDFVFKLPDSISFEEGAMIEPLSVGLFAVKRAEQKLGDIVVVLGAGTIGLMTLQAAKASGAGMIIITDIDDKKLDYAKKLGANVVVNMKKENLSEVLESLGIKNEIDVVYDAVGIGATAVLSVDIARIGGKIVWIGLSNEEKPFPFGKVTFKEIEIRGMFRYANMYPIAIKCLTQGLFDLKGFITSRVPLNELPEKMKQLAAGNTNDMKVIVEIDD